MLNLHGNQQLNLTNIQHPWIFFSWLKGDFVTIRRVYDIKDKLKEQRQENPQAKHPKSKKKISIQQP